jgi:hypothetical protein
LLDDGNGADQAAGDGIYSGRWTPSATGSYTLAFPGGDQAAVEVLDSYVPTEIAPADYNYLTISGTNLNLGDDSVASVTSPFPIQFGGGSFSNLYVSSNGTISFTDMFGDYSQILPQSGPPFTLVQPWWEDLYPVPNTGHNVFWDVIGTAPNRQLVVEWRDVQLYACREDAAATIKFQVVFTEGSSNLIYNYANTTLGANCVANVDEDNAGGATIGLQIAPAQDATWSFYRQSVASGTGLLWTTVTAALPANPVPTLTSMSPTSANWGDPDFWLTVNGSGFVPQSRVLFGLYYCYTRFISSTQVMALVPRYYLTLEDPGTLPILVENPPPGGGWPSSGNLTFTLNYPAPVITAVTPNSVTAGGFGFLLKVDGQGFSLDSQVMWNGQRRQSAIDGTSLYAGILMSDISTAGTGQVTVFNPTPGGGTSNSVSVTIAPPAPSLGTTITATNAGTTTIVNGSNAGKHVPKIVPRFLGWKLAQQLGPAYVQHFLGKTLTGKAIPAAASRGGVAGLRANTGKLSQDLSSNLLPGFASNVNLPTDFLPTAVATGDFNGDGKMDWAVANGGSNTIWIYLGNRDGTARVPTIIPLNGQSPVALAVADLRGIGKLDLIVAEADSQQVSVFLGSGDGTFGPEAPYLVPGAPLCLLVDHFRKSGPLDIVAALANTQGNGELVLLPGDGTGKFGPPVFQDPPIPYSAWFADGIVAADLNGDGLPDLIVNDQGAGGLPQPGVFAYLNNGDGTFTVSQPFVDFPAFAHVITSIAVADINGDGCVDLIDTDTEAMATVFPGNCDGTFQNSSPPAKYALGDIAVTATLTDVNGDGHPDLITTGAVMDSAEGYGQESGSLVSVLFGDGKGGFQNARVYRSEPSMYSVAIADINGDGHPDILTASQDGDLVSVLLNDGSGGFSSLDGAYIGNQVGGNYVGGQNLAIFGARFADLNGDGITDIAALELPWTMAVPYTIDVLLGDSKGDFSVHKRSPVLDASIRVGDYGFGDFRKTGLGDFIAVGQGSSSYPPASFIAFAKNNGDGTFTALPVTQPAGAYGLLGIGDFNGDGKLDIVVMGQNLTVFLGNGDGTFTPGYSVPFNPASGQYPFQLFVGDFNGDHKLDVLVRMASNTVIAGSAGYDVYEFLGNGDGTFGSPKLVIPNCGPIAVGDLNHDGRPDVVAQVEPFEITILPSPGRYNVYLAQPDGSFISTNTYQPYAGLTSPSIPTLADVNGDGNPDIAVFQCYTVGGPAAGQSSDWCYLQVLLGNGDGTFTPSYATADFHESWLPQYLADVNGDGKADLIELDGFTNSAHVIPATSGPALQASLVSYPLLGSQGTVRVNLAVAGSSDTTIQLSASDAAVTIPATATIPAGNASVDVPFRLGTNFNPNRVFTITAALGAQTAIAYGWKTNVTNSPGFLLSLSSYAQSVAPSQTTAGYTAYVNAVNNYSTTVQLSCNGLPSWAACQFGTPTMDLTPGAVGQSTLVVATTSAAVDGNYSFNVVATDGTVTQSVVATLQVVGAAPAPALVLEATPCCAMVSAGQSGSFYLAVSSQGAAAGTVSLQCSNLPTGATCAFDPPAPVLAAGGSVSDVLTLQVNSAVPAPSYPFTSYPFTVSATLGSLTSQSSLTLQVPGTPASLTGSISPTAATLSVGQSANFNITLNSQNGATGAVTLQCLNVPSGLSCAFTPSSPMLPANGSVTDQLTVHVNSRPSLAPPGASGRWRPWCCSGSVLWLTALVAGCLLIGMELRRRNLNIAAALAMILGTTLLFAATASCGGGGGGNAGPNPTPSPVTATITVQASCAGVTGAQAIGTLSITVN